MCPRWYRVIFHQARKVALGNSCSTRSFMHHPVFHDFCLVNPVASLGFRSCQVAVIIFQGECFVFPDFFKIKKLFSSTGIFSVKNLHLSDNESLVRVRARVKYKSSSSQDPTFIFNFFSLLFISSDCYSRNDV